MRIIPFAFLLFLSPLSFLFAQTKAKNPAYEVDSLSSNLTWTGHAAVGNYAPTGTLKLSKSNVLYNGAAVSGGRFVIDMRTLANENSDLQNHLRDADFFDVEKYPTAVFTITKVQKGIATGLLTIKKITKPISFPVQIRKEIPGLHISGTASIDRTRFGIKYNSPNFFKSLGDNAIADKFELNFTVIVRLPVK